MDGLLLFHDHRYGKFYTGYVLDRSSEPSATFQGKRQHKWFGLDSNNILGYHFDEKAPLASDPEQDTELASLGWGAASAPIPSVFGDAPAVSGCTCCCAKAWATGSTTRSAWRFAPHQEGAGDAGLTQSSDKVPPGLIDELKPLKQGNDLDALSLSFQASRETERFEKEEASLKPFTEKQQFLPTACG